MRLTNNLVMHQFLMTWLFLLRICDGQGTFMDVNSLLAISHFLFWMKFTFFYTESLTWNGDG